MLELSGTEDATIELSGTVAPTAIRPLLAPSQLAAELTPDGVRVSLLLFRMQGLHLRGLPWPAFSYGEALWRISVHHRGLPAWLAIACDLDSSFIRASGARLIRYPVRRARFSFSPPEPAFCAEVAGADGAVVVRATPSQNQPPPEPPRPLLVHENGTLYRIPWREKPAPYRRIADLDTVEGQLAETTFHSQVSWDPTGLVHRGRIHFCGVARQTDPPSS